MIKPNLTLPFDISFAILEIFLGASVRGEADLLSLKNRK
jgi:hypothetical protein